MNIPVPASEAAKAFQRACDALDRDDRRAARRRFLIGCAAILAAPGTASGWLWHVTHPLTIYRDVLIPLGANGVPLAAFDNSADAAAAMGADPAINSAWLYVKAMEGYSANRENESWMIATQMAEQKLAEAYRRERDPRDKASRAQRYGRRYEILIERDSEIDVCDARGCGDTISGYQMRYWRVVRDTTTDSEVERIMCEAVVRFRRGVPGFTVDFVRQYNAARIQVSSYTKGEPLGAVRTRFPG